MSIGIEIERPQRNEAMMKSAVVARKSRTWPKRCVSQPVSGTEIAFATANDVITHVPWFGDTPRSPAIAGIDTLAIDVSSTFMKVARPTASEARSRSLPSSGLFAGGGATDGAHPGREIRVLGDDALDALVRLRVRLGGGEHARLERRPRGASLLEPGARALVRVDVDPHREADLQRMRLELLRLERDA